MRSQHLLRAAAAPFIVYAGLGMQDRPDFSGTWAVVQDPAISASTTKPPAGAYGPQFSIRHEENALTLTRTIAGTPTTINYTLNGSETTSRVPGRLCEPDSGAIWRATTDGQTVTLAMIGAVSPKGEQIKTEVSTTLRFDTPETLRIMTTARAAGQATPRTTSTVYKRTGPPPPAAAPVEKTRARIAQVEWISGTWIGTAGATTFEERWTPAAAGSMMAISRTLRDGVMSAFEYLCIVERDGGLVYVAMPNGRMPPTDFTLTKIDADNAIFENPAHDFPKMIRYTRRADGSLEAVVGGAEGQKPQTFLFKKS